MSFLTHTSENVLWMSSSLLDGSDVRHGFSTRIGGVSPAPWDSLNLGVGRGDDMDRVRENYRRFCAALGVDEHRAVLSKQVHEDNGPPCDGGGLRQGPVPGPGLYQRGRHGHGHPGDPPGGVLRRLRHHPAPRPGAPAVGAAHAGWRGAAGGIVYKTVRRMQELFGTDPGTCGPPSGRPSAPAVLKRTRTCPRLWRPPWGRRRSRISPGRGPKWHVDLKGVNARWLEKAGVRQIDVSPDCTACHPELYWSHRRMGQARGAQIAMICL